MQDRNTFESDIQYLKNALQRINSNAIKKYTQGEITAETCCQQIWRFPRLMTDYFYQLIPQSERQSIYPVISYLNEHALITMKKLNIRENIFQAVNQQVIQSKNQFQFRPWTEQDADIYCDFLNNPALWAGIVENRSRTLNPLDAKELILGLNSTPWHHSVFAIEHHQSPIGQIRLQYAHQKQRKIAEISYWLGQKFWNQGIMSQVLPLFTQQSFKSDKLDSIFALVLESNIASQRLLAKSGYRLDVGRYKRVQKNGRAEYLMMYRAFSQDFIQDTIDYDYQARSISARGSYERRWLKR